MAVLRRSNDEVAVLHFFEPDVVYACIRFMVANGIREHPRAVCLRLPDVRVPETVYAGTELFFVHPNPFEKEQKINEVENDFQVPECYGRDENFFVRMPDGEEIPIQDPRIRLVTPSMGLISDSGTAVFRAWGIKSERVDIPDFETLRLGRANTSCKECLPLIVTTGSLLEYLEKKRKKEEILVYFMPGASGGCRFGQYNVFLRRLIKNKRIPEATIMSLDPDLGWSGFPMNVQIGLLKAFTVADCGFSVLNAIRALAVDRPAGLEIFWHEWDKIVKSLACF